MTKYWRQQFDEMAEDPIPDKPLPPDSVIALPKPPHTLHTVRCADRQSRAAAAPLQIRRTVQVLGVAGFGIVRARQARGVVHGGMLGGQGLGRDDNLPIKKWKGCLWAALPRWARDKID